ncbi:MAG: response regulator [Candidatus Riflebacteria bacterium]|nr:response regulator [Candidatus Riflebacteria bacterium]
MTETILVVDDNPQIRQIGKAHLTAAGFAVLTAESGEQALDVFQGSRIDLVLLDILMDGIDGCETCRRLRKLPGGDVVPVVFITAVDDLATQGQAMTAGGDDFLMKPIGRTELLIRVRSLLRIKRLQTELQQSNLILRQQRDELIRIQKQKESLTAFLVHDLKNPLTNILGFGQLLREAADLSEATREDVDRVVSAASGMRNMVMNLLDISRSEDGQLVPRPAPVDLPGLVAAICETGASRARLGKKQLSSDVNLADRPLRADADLLRRLIENLVDNSLKYAPGGGEVKIGARWADDQRVILTVSDLGPGIPPEFREKIFDKFVQLDPDASSHGRVSRGLGLAFCRLVAEVHGGRIWVEDNHPTGTVFKVEIRSVS